MYESGLIRAALEARKNAYAPYSGFYVGAALLADSGKVYTGCNVENAAYSPGICAERTAFVKAVSEGELSFTAIAVVGAPKDAPTAEFGLAWPCGVCRQVMAEFCKPESFIVLVAKSESCYERRTLAELLPCGFGL